MREAAASIRSRWTARVGARSRSNRRPTAHSSGRCLHVRQTLTRQAAQRGTRRRRSGRRRPTFRTVLTRTATSAAPRWSRCCGVRRALPRHKQFRGRFRCQLLRSGCRVGRQERHHHRCRQRKVRPGCRLHPCADRYIPVSEQSGQISENRS